MRQHPLGLKSTGHYRAMASGTGTDTAHKGQCVLLACYHEKSFFLMSWYVFFINFFFSLLNGYLQLALYIYITPNITNTRITTTPGTDIGAKWCIHMCCSSSKFFYIIYFSFWNVNSPSSLASSQVFYLLHLVLPSHLY